MGDLICQATGQGEWKEAGREGLSYLSMHASPSVQRFPLKISFYLSSEKLSSNPTGWCSNILDYLAKILLHLHWNDLVTSDSKRWSVNDELV